MYTHDVNLEIEKLESTEDVDSAQAGTVTLHKDWLAIKSGDVGVQKSLSNLFSSKGKLEVKSEEASEKYFRQGEPRKRPHHADLTRIYQV